MDRALTTPDSSLCQGAHDRVREVRVALRPTTSDDELVARLRSGDERSFERLFHAEYASLCAFAELIVESPQVAEDVVQSMFLKLWSGRAQLPLVKSLRGYLFTSTRNAALDHRKKLAVERKWGARPEWLDERDVERQENDNELASAEQARTLREAIERLPKRAQVVVTMRWLQGMSHREIAEALGISVKGVEIQITRALRVLRAHLGTRAE